jgi:hypothetical protein
VSEQCNHRWSGDDGAPYCLVCGEGKEITELREGYAKAVALLGDAGLVLVIAGVHKHPLVAKWLRARHTVLRTPRAQAILVESAKAFGIEAT